MKKLLYSLLIVNCSLFIDTAFGNDGRGDGQSRDAAIAAAIAAANGGVAPMVGGVGGVGSDEARAAVWQGELPVRVADPALEAAIRAGTGGVSIANLESCRMIWMNGSFSWAVPDVGVPGVQRAPTCVAEIYLKAAPAGQNPGGPNDKILAVAHVPAGSTIKCNISDFPQSGYLPAAGEVIFPRDAPPEEADVIEAMNREQKQNAAIKTVTAALIGGVGMYLAAKDSGNTGATVALTAAGAVGAGGLAYASTQSGKVAGDVMMSAGMNTVAGAVMGNIGAGMGNTGEHVVIKDCVGDKDDGLKGQKCIWGHVTT
jgi:hypothetical protein